MKVQHATEWSHNSDAEFVFLNKSYFTELKEETEELSRCLSVDITILDFKEDMMLADYKRELEEQIAG